MPLRFQTGARSEKRLLTKTRLRCGLVKVLRAASMASPTLAAQLSDMAIRRTPWVRRKRAWRRFSLGEGWLTSHSLYIDLARAWHMPQETGTPNNTLRISHGNRIVTIVARDKVAYTARSQGR